MCKQTRQMQLQLSSATAAAETTAATVTKTTKQKGGKVKSNPKTSHALLGCPRIRKMRLSSFPLSRLPLLHLPLSLAPLNRPQVRNLTEATVPGVWLCLRLRAEYPAPSCCHRVPPSAECRVQSAECSLYFVRSSLLPVPSFQFLVASAKCQVQRHVQVH